MKIILLFACLMCVPGLYAQDANEFQRVAKRIMDAYDVGEELQHAPDSANFFGGAYLGASSNGRAMPSGYLTYLKDKLLFMPFPLSRPFSSFLLSLIFTLTDFATIKPNRQQ